MGVGSDAAVPARPIPDLSAAAAAAGRPAPNTQLTLQPILYVLEHVPNCSET